MSKHLPPTRAWLRIKKQIDEHSQEGAEVDRIPAMRAGRLLENPKGEGMATAKQKAAARRNIKKAQAARRKTRGVRRTTRRRRRRRAVAIAPVQPRRRRRRAVRRRARAVRRRAPRRRVRRRARARRRTAARTASRQGGVRLVRVRRSSQPIIIEETQRGRRATRRRRRRAAPRRRRRREEEMMLENAGMRFKHRRRDSLGLLENPDDGYESLMENQVFTVSAVRAFGMAGMGVGLGLVIADGLDRYVATRKPTNGNNPWYGANAAAAQNHRPDAWRLGAQAAGGVGSIALAYAVRGRAILPWLLGGTAIGFFANLTKQLVTWWVMPMALKVDAGNEATLANRMYPLEQKSVQDMVDSLFENWASETNLAANQAATPTIMPVLPKVPEGPVYTLGRRGNGYSGKSQAQAAEPSRGQVGQPVLVQTGRLGDCGICGGHDGCWSNCPDLTLCGDCPDMVARRCQYVVQPTDPSVNELAAGYGVDVGTIAAEREVWTI